MDRDDFGDILHRLEDYKNECKQQLKWFEVQKEQLNYMHAFFKTRLGEIESACDALWRALGKADEEDE